MKKGIIFFLFLTLSVYGANQSYEKIWVQRNNLTQNHAKKIYKVYQPLLKQDSQNYKLWWQYSRALNFYGMYFASSRQEKIKIYAKAKTAAENAVQISPDGIDGHVWLGITLGNWGRSRGVLKSLKVIPDVVKNMQEVITKAPSRNEAVAYRVMGTLYFRAPGSPLSIGNKEKSLEYFKKAIQLAPNNKKNYLYISQVYYSKKKYAVALDYVKKALNKPIRPKHKIEELHDIAKLKKMKQKIFNRMK